MIHLHWTANNQLVVPVRVTPKGRRDSVLPFSSGDEAIKLKVACPPEDGKANAAVIALLASMLGIPKSRVTLVQGDKSRQKRVALRDITLPETPALLEKLANAMQTNAEAVFLLKTS